jgi:hypothetical protein
VRSGLVTDEIAAVPASAHQLHMVLDELVHTWGMLMLGQWPRERFLGAGGLPELDGVPAADGDAVAPAASGVAMAVIEEPLQASWRPVPIAVANMAGATLGRIMRKLLGSERRVARARHDDAHLRAEEEVDEGESDSGGESVVVSESAA